MPYTIRKQNCNQADGDSGSFTLNYTDKHGKIHKICHTSKQNARKQIAAIEMREEELIRECVLFILMETEEE